MGAIEPAQANKAMIGTAGKSKHMEYRRCTAGKRHEHGVPAAQTFKAGAKRCANTQMTSVCVCVWGGGGGWRGGGGSTGAMHTGSVTHAHAESGTC